MRPTVSILTTVFNRERYLQECIESVITSTYSNWELIIVDDCSSDNSVKIAKSYSNKDPRIKLHINEKNLGDYPNRNKAASLAKGKYIKYLDADDLLYPHGLEIMLETMEKFSDCALGISQEVLEDYEPYPFKMTPEVSYKRQFLRRGVLGVPPSLTIVKKEIFDSIGGFSGERFTGDFELWLKIAAAYPIVKIQSGLVFWRKHEGQEYDIGMKEGHYIIQYYLLKNSILMNSSCPLPKKDVTKVFKRIKKRHAHDIINMIIKKRKLRKGIEIMNKTQFSLFRVIKNI